MPTLISKYAESRLARALTGGQGPAREFVDAMNVSAGLFGNVFYVDSGHSNAKDGAGGGSKDMPFATLDFAIGRCTASNGDVIYVMPGHSETYTSAGALALDVAGITIVGLGHGSNRPTFLLDSATTTDINVTAADVRIFNCRFGAGHADIVECFDLSASGFELHNCEFYDNAADENFVDYIKTTTTDNECDDLKVIGCRVLSPDTGNDAFVEINGDLDGLVFVDNFVRLGVQDNEAILSVATGKDVTNCEIVGNRFFRLNTAGDIVIDSDTTANSGIVAFNVVAHADTAGEVPFDIDGAYPFENYASGVTSASGYLLPTADS